MSGPGAEQKYVFLDLFAGFGGASQAFVEHPDWIVQRLDNNQLLSGVEHMTIADIKDFHAEVMYNHRNGWRPARPIHILWASIPCVEVSLAYNSARSVADRNGEEFTPHTTLELLDITLDLIDVLNPQYWVIENVRGALKYFNPIMGKPAQIIASKYVLWGAFPHIICNEDELPSKMLNDTSSNDPLRPNKRAIIPYPISKGLLEAYHQQKQLFDYCSIG